MQREGNSSRPTYLKSTRKLAELKSASDEQVAHDQATADAAVIAQMRRRMARAQARGDSDAADRYSAIIDQLQRTNK